MPSPIGHTPAGFCGYILMYQQVKRHQRRWLLLSTVLTVNLADFDMLPGLMVGDPGAFQSRSNRPLAITQGGYSTVTLFAKLRG